MKRLTPLLLAVLFVTLSCAPGGTNAKENTKSDGTMSTGTPDGAKVLIETSKGNMTVLLYDATPKHRDNFLKLTKEGFYNDILFHRVIKGFMVQTGDPESKGAEPGKQLGGGGPGYMLDAEILPQFYHKKGALAAARTGDQVNPERRSSGSQFYIVQGTVQTDEQMAQMAEYKSNMMKQGLFQAYLQEPESKDKLEALQKFQQERNRAGYDSIMKIIVPIIEERATKEEVPGFSEQQKADYATIGGAPNLDGQYTVFGEVLEGLSVVDSIAAVKTFASDRPEEDVKIISMKVLD